MTRWLACLGLCCALWVALIASFALAQRPRPDGGGVSKTGVPKTTAATVNARSDRSQDVRRLGDQLNSCQESDRADEKNQDKRSDGRRAEDGRRPGGGRHEGGSGDNERRFIYDAVRRTGGSLELLPLLFVPEVRRQLQVDEQVFKPKLDAYMAEMQKRIDENRKQVASEPKSRRGELFAKHLRQENERFQEFLDELPQSQRDQLIYLFVQARNYRSLSNQLVVAKMGMSEDASTIRQEIDAIREQTMDETRDRFRRIFDQGGGRDEFEKLVRENQRKMDARIEKKLTEAQREKFAELRSKTSAEAPEWLVRAIDFPFQPGSSHRSKSKEQSSRKSQDD